MTPSRGQLWWASLGQSVGSEQTGARPVLVLQHPVVATYTSTFLAIPLTTNLRRATLPSCVVLPEGAAGLPTTSVVLCHQLRVLDGSRLTRLIGMLPQPLLAVIEGKVLFTLGIGEPRPS